jgi:hypothetical protein
MFVSVKFREGDSRTYTYTCDLDVNPGDKVTVEGKGEQKIVTVAEVDLPEPSFACKPITGIAPPKTAPEGGEDNGESLQ